MSRAELKKYSMIPTTCNRSDLPVTVLYDTTNGKIKHVGCDNFENMNCDAEEGRKMCIYVCKGQTVATPKKRS